MKTSKIVIKNLFGIRETTLDGKSVEISGPKGAGKTSVLDAIRFALTNRSERDCIVHQGADEGEIIIETTTGLSIDRKALPAKSAGTVKVRDGSLLQTRPAEFLSQIFTPLQLNPVEFTQLSRQEKNRVILSLIEFDWDVNWIREQFGEIPQGVDYSKHILEVLNDIQAENGVYFQSRQNINRDIRNKQAFISDIAKDIPSGYDYDRWNQYPIGERYRELERLREKNSVIERAKAFRANFTSKLRGLEGSRDVEIGAIDRDIAAERAALTGSIERMKAELQATDVYFNELTAELVGLIKAATGHALVLFTSYAAMSAVKERLREESLPFPLLTLGRNAPHIIEQFRHTSGAVLLATGAAWEGFDFPGDCVSLLVIPRLPFAYPDARKERELEKYSSLRAFIREVAVPEMQIKLRQGFGRAIRTESDTCVIAILDERACRGRRYAQAVSEALPEMRRTGSLREVTRFLREKKPESYFEVER